METIASGPKEPVSKWFSYAAYAFEVAVIFLLLGGWWLSLTAMVVGSVVAVGSLLIFLLCFPVSWLVGLFMYAWCSDFRRGYISYEDEPRFYQMFVKILTFVTDHWLVWLAKGTTIFVTGVAVYAITWSLSRCTTYDYSFPDGLFRNFTELKKGKASNTRIAERIEDGLFFLLIFGIGSAATVLSEYLSTEETWWRGNLHIGRGMQFVLAYLLATAIFFPLRNKFRQRHEFFDFLAWFLPILLLLTRK